MNRTILIVGTFDTKGAEYAFLREQILALGGDVVTLNAGTLGSTDLFPVDVEADDVARAGGEGLVALRQRHDRGAAMAVSVSATDREITITAPKSIR